MSIHEGHRSRTRERFFQDGLDGFSEIEALELLLYYAIPRQDTNPLAHRLLDHFGNLDYVLGASEQELCEVPGVSKHTAALIMLVRQMTRRGEISRTANIKSIASVEEAAAFLVPRFHGEADEKLILLCLDCQMRITHCEVINHGVVNSVLFDLRKIVETALKRRADTVILAHNHPNGPLLASREDDDATSALYRALDTVHILLYDHLIVFKDQYISYRQSGAMDLFRYTL